MDVLCCGMYRSCSTWQYDVVAHLLERHRGGRRFGYLTGDQYAALAAREPGGGWRVLKSHEEHPAFTRALAEGRARAVYAFRDVRDVVFSMLHKRRVGFSAFVRQGMVHQILANDRFWTARPGLLIQRYGDLLVDPVTGVEELAAHLGIALSGEEAAEVAAEYTMEANRRRAEALARRLRERGIDVADPANAQHHDGRTLLHWNHVRQGQIGGWRDEATLLQRAVLRRIVAPWLVERGYESGTSWAGDGPGWPGAAAERLRWELVLAEGSLRCAARCAGLRYPRAASWVKGLLGLSATDPAAVNRPTAGAAHRNRYPIPYERFRRSNGRSQARTGEGRPSGADRSTR